MNAHKILCGHDMQKRIVGANWSVGSKYMNVSNYMNNLAYYNHCIKCGTKILTCSVCGNDVSMRFVENYYSYIHHVIEFHWKLDQFILRYNDVKPVDRSFPGPGIDIHGRHMFHICLLAGDLSDEAFIEEYCSLPDGNTKLFLSKLTKCLICDMNYDCTPSNEVVINHVSMKHFNVLP